MSAAINYFRWRSFFKETMQEKHFETVLHVPINYAVWLIPLLPYGAIILAFSHFIQFIHLSSVMQCVAVTSSFN